MKLSYGVNNWAWLSYGAMWDSVDALQPFQTRTIRIDDDSHFVCKKLSGSFSDAGAIASPQSALALIEVMVTDMQSGNQIFDQPVLWSTFFGGGIYPYLYNASYRMDMPMMFSAGSLINIQVRHIGLGGAPSYKHVNVGFIGTKHAIEA